MRVCLTKSFVVAVHLTELQADVRLVDGDLVPVDSRWCLHVITSTQASLNYFFSNEAAAVDAYTQLNEPGLNHEFECVELQH